VDALDILLLRLLDKVVPPTALFVAAQMRHDQPSPGAPVVLGEKGNPMEIVMIPRFREGGSCFRSRSDLLVAVTAYFYVAVIDIRGEGAGPASERGIIADFAFCINKADDLLGSGHPQLRFVVALGRHGRFRVRVDPGFSKSMCALHVRTG